MNMGPLLALALGIGCAPAQSPVTPPVMTRRSIAPSTNELQGTQIKLMDRGTNFTLFLPHGWTNVVSSNTTASVHFHGAPWFVIQEHVRRGAKEPLLAFALGEGSSTYRAPFLDTNRLARVLALAESELKARSGKTDAKIASIDVSSFSAGYGAVRELVRTPASFAIIRRIALLDSMYAGLEPQQDGSTNRVPLADQIDVWVPFARAAMRGEKTFVITHSQIPTTYASTFECAAALLGRVGLKSATVPTNSIPAANDPAYYILSRADANGLHVWSYAGTDAQAHMTHARHLADVWRALDEIESKSVKAAGQ